MSDETTTDLAVQQQRYLDKLNSEVMKTDVAAVQSMRRIIDNGEDDALRMKAAEIWLNARQKQLESKEKADSRNQNNFTFTFVKPPGYDEATVKDREVFDVAATVSEEDSQ